MPFSGHEMLIVTVVLLLFFGGSRLPKLARSLGEARRELRDVAASDEMTPLAAGDE